jgi:hypothetical protein
MEKLEWISTGVIGVINCIVAVGVDDEAME